MIPPDKLEEISGRIAAREREHTLAITAQLQKRHSVEKAQADAKARADLEVERQQSAIREARAREDAQRAAENLISEKTAEAERARQELIAGWQQQIAAAELARQTSAAELEVVKAEARRRELEIRADAKQAAELAVAERIAAIEAAHRESEAGLRAQINEADQNRMILEKAKEDAVNAEKAKAFEENQKLCNKVSDLQRALEKKTAEELGEGAEIDLFDALKKEFPSDDITRISKGAPGADIRHVVVLRGQECGTILYDSKNHNAFRNEHVTKLKTDQLAAKAEHAILSTHKFPQGARQFHIHDGVLLANPARVVSLASLIRQHLLQVYTLRLSSIERETKTGVLYEFITSERYSLLLGRIDERATQLLDQQAKEIKWHENNWRKQGEAYRAIQKAKADLENEVSSIIGTSADDSVMSEAS